MKQHRNLRDLVVFCKLGIACISILTIPRSACAQSTSVQSPPTLANPIGSAPMDGFQMLAQSYVAAERNAHMLADASGLTPFKCQTNQSLLNHTVSTLNSSCGNTSLSPVAGLDGHQLLPTVSKRPY
jgi:hypothetical protein